MFRWFAQKKLMLEKTGKQSFLLILYYILSTVYLEFNYWNKPFMSFLLLEREKTVLYN